MEIYVNDITEVAATQVNFKLSAPVNLERQGIFYIHIGVADQWSNASTDVVQMTFNLDAISEIKGCGHHYADEEDSEAGTFGCPTPGGIAMTIYPPETEPRVLYAGLKVFIGGHFCNEPNVADDFGSLDCILPAGTGTDVEVYVVLDDLESPSIYAVSYQAPSVSSISTSHALCDAGEDSLQIVDCNRTFTDDVKLQVHGANFGVKGMSQIVIDLAF